MESLVVNAQNPRCETQPGRTAPSRGRAFWKGRRVLVTGHTGFIGGWLCHALAMLQAEVAGYADTVPTTPSLFQTTALKDRLHDYRGDIADLPNVQQAVAMHQPSVVFHLAAQPLVRVAFAEPLRTYRANVLGTVAVLEAIRSSPGVALGVMMTTDKVYLNRGGRTAYREDDRLGGNEPYSVSKVLAEMVIAQYRTSYLDRQRVVAVRAGNVIGGGDWAPDRIVPDAIRAWNEGRPLEIRSPRSTRTWQHVIDVVEALMLLAENALSEQQIHLKDAYNVGPHMTSAISVKAFTEKLAGAWGSGAGFTLAAKPAAIPESAHLHLDSTLFHDQFGWRPRFDLDRSIELSVAWYRQVALGHGLRELMENQLDSVVACRA